MRMRTPRSLSLPLLLPLLLLGLTHTPLLARAQANRTIDDWAPEISYTPDTAASIVHQNLTGFQISKLYNGTVTIMNATELSSVNMTMRFTGTELYVFLAKSLFGHQVVPTLYSNSHLLERFRRPAPRRKLNYLRLCDTRLSTSSSARKSPPVPKLFMARAKKTGEAGSLLAEGKASWTDQDLSDFVAFLTQSDILPKLAEGSFPAPVFRAAAEHLNLTRTAGGPKTENACKAKFNAMKKVWNLVNHIKGMSGWHWDDGHGVTVDDAFQNSWDAWVALNPDAKKFVGKGWAYYERMVSLMPTQARGMHVFRSRPAATPAPSTARTAASASGRSSSPPWDEAAMDRSFGGSSGKGLEGEEEGEEEDEEESGPTGALSSSPTPLQNTKKRVAAQPTSRATRQRTSTGAAALTMVSDAVQDFNGIMADIGVTMRALLPSPAPAPSGLAPASSPAPHPLPSLPTTAIVAPTSNVDVNLPTTPHRRRAAIKLAQKENWLLPTQIVVLIQILSDPHNSTKADAYIDFEMEILRVGWVIAELRQRSVYASHPKYPELDLDPSYLGMA